MKLTCESVSRRFLRNSQTSNFFYAVRDCNLVMESGVLTEIIGRSGSGKSTLLNMLAGILEPSEGKVLLDRADLYSLPDGPRSQMRGQCIGVVPQGQTGLHSLTVLENVLLPCRLAGERVEADRAMEILEKVGIADLGNAYPNELSGGEMRRMAIARAMIRKPGILLADEPTGDLDDENTKAVLKLFRVAADGGAAVLLVTHEQEAVSYADRLYRMDSGILTQKY